MKSKETQIIKLFMAKVKKSMDKEKLSQSQLAFELGISSVHLSNVLTGKYNPGFKTLWQLYNYFKYDFNIFDEDSYL